MVSDLKLFLFTTDVVFAKNAEVSTIDSIIVDWEHKDKEQRQKTYDTEINCNTPEDVQSLSEAVNIPITVRINALGQSTEDEILTAIDCGAKIIMLPMAREVIEVENFLRLVNGRAKTIIQLETQSLFEQCASLQNLDWTYLYIGLNDLMVSRQASWIWEPLIDGTIEKIFTILHDREVGFAGVTIIGGGYPISFTDLLKEMARYGCSLSFLRRTFKREIIGRDFHSEIQAIRSAWTAAIKRSPQTVETDHATFVQKLLEMRKFL